MLASLLGGLVYILKTGIHLYFLMVLTRFLFQYFKVDVYNPLIQWVFKTTNPPLMRLEPFFPRLNRIELSALFLMFALKMIECSLTLGLLGQGLPSLPALLLWSVGEIVRHSANLLMMFLIVRAALSWIEVRNQAALSALLFTLTEPLLTPFRRWFTQSPIDVSTVLALVALQVFNMVVAENLLRCAYLLS